MPSIQVPSAPSTTANFVAAAIAPYEPAREAKRFVPAVPDLRTAHAKTKKQEGVGATGGLKPNIAALNVEEVGVLLSYRGARRSSFGAFHELELKGEEGRRPTLSPTRRNSF